MKRKLLLVLAFFAIVCVAKAQYPVNSVDLNSLLNLKSEKSCSAREHNFMVQASSVPQPMKTSALKAPSALPDVKVFGYVIFNGTRGFVSMMSNTPGTLSLESDYRDGANVVACGEYLNGKIYGYTRTSSWVLQNFVVLTEDWNQISSVPVAQAPQEMAYDYSTGTMYGLDLYNAGGSVWESDLYTIDLTSGAMTLVAPVTPGFLVFACSKEGQLYGITFSGDFYSINKTTGATTLIGATGFSPSNAQSMAFDHNSGRLFWAYYGWAGSKLVEINPLTGAGTHLGNISGNPEITTLYTPYIHTPQPAITVITSQPVDASICKGSNHTFKVSATGDNLTYQWYKGNNPIFGAINNTLTIPDATAMDYEMYHVEVKGDRGTVISNKARLWVAEPLPDQLKFNMYPNPAQTGTEYLVRLSGYADVTKYSWSYSSPDVTFKPVVGRDNETLVTFGTAAVGTGTLSAILEHVCGTRTATQNMTVNYSSGINDLSKGEVKMYPNPVGEVLHIVAQEGNSSLQSVVVTDINGRVIYRINGLTDTNELSISSSSWSKGIYLVKVMLTSEMGNHVFKVHKVIKN